MKKLWFIAYFDTSSTTPNTVAGFQSRKGYEARSDAEAELKRVAGKAAKESSVYQYALVELMSVAEIPVPAINLIEIK